MTPIIDIRSVVGELNAIIILHPTGIKYTAQCGGIGCTHPQAEGFAISVGNFGEDFNDCSYGCAYLDAPDMEEARKKLGSDFDDYCLDHTKSWRWNIRFDFDRVDEVQEGWIPVILNGKLDPFEDYTFQKTKAIFHGGNCD